VERKKQHNRTLIFDEEGLSSLALRIKQIRNTKKITQEELAFRSELTLSQIARIETVRINPTVSTMFRIAKALDVPMKELFDFEEISLNPTSKEK
jgi:transcriptional regulator with XRE-family HTH domain